MIHGTYPTVLAQDDSLGGDWLILDVDDRIDTVVEREHVTTWAQPSVLADQNATSPPVNVATSVHRHALLELVGGKGWAGG